MPIYVRHSIQFREGTNGKFEVLVGPRSGLGKVVENVTVNVEMPKSVLNMTLTPSQGRYKFDSAKKTMVWDVGRIDPAKLPSIKGNVRSLRLFYMLKNLENTHISYLITNSFIDFAAEWSSDTRIESTSSCKKFFSF